MRFMGRMAGTGFRRGDDVSDYLDDTIANIEDVEGWTGWPATDSEARDLVAGFIDEMTDVGAQQRHTLVALAIVRLLREHSRS